jgi:hypothetical protein
MLNANKTVRRGVTPAIPSKSGGHHVADIQKSAQLSHRSDLRRGLGCRIPNRHHDRACRSNQTANLCFDKFAIKARTKAQLNQLLCEHGAIDNSMTCDKAGKCGTTACAITLAPLFHDARVPVMERLT